MEKKTENSKYRSEKSAGSVVKKIIAVVLAIVIVFGIGYYFGIPQKAAKCVKIDGKSYSMAEYQFYYMSMWMTYYNYASQYGSYYVNGFDSTKAPAMQSMTTDDGKTMTFDKFFEQAAIENMADVKRYYTAAVDAGTKLNDEDNKTIEETLSQFDSYLGNYSLSSYLSKRYGKGITEKLYKKIVTEQTLVSRFQEDISDKFKAEISEDTVKKVYNEDKTAYDVVDFRWYTIDITDGNTAAAEATADKFIQSVKDDGNTVDAFKKNAVKYLDTSAEDYNDNLEAFSKDAATALFKTSASTLTSNVGQGAVDWLFAKDSDGKYTVKAGEIKRFTNDKAVYVIYSLGTPYADETKAASVRHILFRFPENEDGSEVTAEQKNEVKAKAEEALNQYKSGLAEGVAFDEDAFSALASEKSEDTGSKENGGLIENMTNNNSYVQNFEDWTFGEGAYKGEKRAEGDTAVVETEYGYHVMYYVGQDEHAQWYTTILDNLVTEKTDAYWKDFEAKFENPEEASKTAEDITNAETEVEDTTGVAEVELPYGVSKVDFLIGLATKNANKIIESTIENN